MEMPGGHWEWVQQLLNDFWKQQFPGQDTISRAGHLCVLVDCGLWVVVAEKGRTTLSVPAH